VARTDELLCASANGDLTAGRTWETGADGPRKRWLSYRLARPPQPSVGERRPAIGQSGAARKLGLSEIAGILHFLPAGRCAAPGAALTLPDES
jgi:hypothetical protein